MDGANGALGWGRRIGALLAVAWLAGCATQEGVLRDTVERELRCPPVGIEVEPRADGRYDVAACGERSVWACQGEDGRDVVCRRQTDEELASVGGDDPGTDVELASTDTSVASSEGDGAAEVTGDQAETEVVPDEEEPGAAPAEQASAPEPEPDPDPAEGGDATDAPAGGTALERAVRAQLDARRQVILECVGRDSVVVSARYQRDGRLRVSLRGGLEGTAEERCVATAVRDLRIAARGRQGTVLHPLRAER